MSKRNNFNARDKTLINAYEKVKVKLCNLWQSFK